MRLSRLDFSVSRSLDRARICPSRWFVRMFIAVGCLIQHLLKFKGFFQFSRRLLWPIAKLGCLTNQLMNWSPQFCHKCDRSFRSYRRSNLNHAEITLKDWFRHFKDHQVTLLSYSPSSRGYLPKFQISPSALLSRSTHKWWKRFKVFFKCSASLFSHIRRFMA